MANMTLTPAELEAMMDDHPELKRFRDDIESSVMKSLEGTLTRNDRKRDAAARRRAKISESTVTWEDPTAAHTTSTETASAVQMRARLAEGEIKRLEAEIATWKSGGFVSRGATGLGGPAGFEAEYPAVFPPEGYRGRSATAVIMDEAGKFVTDPPLSPINVTVNCTSLGEYILTEDGAAVSYPVTKPNEERAIRRRAAEHREAHYKGDPLAGTF